MSLSHLIPAIANYAPLKDALSGIARGENRTLVDMPESMRPVIAAAMVSRAPGPVLVLTSRRDRADALASAIAEYLPGDIRLHQWAAPDAQPWEQLPIDSEASIQRVQVMDALLSKPGAPAIIVASVHALTQLLMSPDDFQTHTIELRVGRRIDTAKLLAWATSVGYQQNPMVQEPGTIARRGGIVDIFPPGAEYPVRVDFFGDDIESIRHFDPHSQRSTERLTSIRLLPPLELPTWRLKSASERVRSVSTKNLRPEVAEEWHRLVDHMRQGSCQPHWISSPATWSRNGRRC